MIAAVGRRSGSDRGGWTDAVPSGGSAGAAETIVLRQHCFLEFFTAAYGGEADKLTLRRNAVPFACLGGRQLRPTLAAETADNACEGG